jgi:Rrf2 family protein
MQEGSRRVQVEEIARRLGVPRHYMSKILKALAKEGVLSSFKGPNGGFGLPAATLQTSMLQVLHITDGANLFNRCVLRLHTCNPENPCPLHARIETGKSGLFRILGHTTIADLLNPDKEHLIQSLITELSPEDLK